MTAGPRGGEPRPSASAASRPSTTCRSRCESGEILGIIGPNGCGKSTLFNCILGQLRPTSGEVRIDGQRVTGMHPPELNYLGVSRTFQLLQVFP